MTTKINNKYSGLIFGISMSIIMSFTMSFCMTLVNVGFVPHFFLIWGKSFLIGFIVALPTSALAVPISKKVVKKLTTENAHVG